MSHADCFRALGVAANTSREDIRQAYKDLGRVWHPDRFQSDPQLQEKAERQLRKVNEAYYTLKNSHTFRRRQPEPAPRPKPADDGPAVSVHPRPRRVFGPLLRILPIRGPLKAVWMGVVCLAPLVFGGLLVKALRLPGLDDIMLPNGTPRPAISTSSQFINPLGDRAAAADALSNWASGKVVDLWKSIPKVWERPSDRPNERPVVAASDAGPQTDDAAPRDPPRRRITAVVAPAMPVYGTELLWTRRSGAGELWLSNETNQDALATLLRAHTASQVRAIYIQAMNKGCMRNVAPGLYDLLADVGDNWDPSHIRFQTGRHALDRSGPFECIDVTSTQGSSGCRYDIVLRTR